MMEMHVPSDEGAVSEVLSDEQRDAVIDGLSDRTPADVTPAGVIADMVAAVTSPALDDVEYAHDIIIALTAAGYRVVPIPDDNTRALAARLRDFPSLAFRYEDTVYEETEHGDQRDRYLADVRAAADLLDGPRGCKPYHCDAWHVGGSGDTR